MAYRAKESSVTFRKNVESKESTFDKIFKGTLLFLVLAIIYALIGGLLGAIVGIFTSAEIRIGVGLGMIGGVMMAAAAALAGTSSRQ